MNKVWILGSEYDLSTAEGQTALMNVIDDAHERYAANDLSAICYGLIRAINSTDDLDAEVEMERELEPA